MALRVLLALLLVAECASAQALGPVNPGPVNVGPGRYNYSPSVFYDQGSQKWRAWWCGLNINAGIGDAVWYAESWDIINWYADLGNLGAGTARIVFEPAPGLWDSAHVCDPSVLAGVAIAGTLYPYAMYYTGSNMYGDNDGRIGVAVSGDGYAWTRLALLTLGCECASSYGCQRFSVVKVRPEHDPAGGRFTAVVSQHADSTGLFSYESWDGIHWTNKTLRCLPQTAGSCSGAPGADLAFDPARGRYLLTYSADTYYGRFEYVVEALATYYGTIGGTTFAELGFYNINNAGTSFRPGFFRDQHGYLARPYGGIHTLVSDRDPHLGETQLLKLSWWALN